MNARKILFALLHLFALPIAAACSPTAGGFDVTPTTLSGTIQRSDGSFVEAMRVHLFAANDQRFVAVTGAGGRFVFESPSEGSRLKLAGHDGVGSGFVVEVQLIPGGENNFGAFVLSPLAELPELMTIPGLGLEERVSSLEGHCRYPIFDASSTHAYCLRSEGDSNFVHVIELELATGNERILSENAEVFDESCGRKPLRIERGRVLVASFRFRTYIFDLLSEATDPPLVYERRLIREGTYCADGEDVVFDGRYLRFLGYRENQSWIGIAKLDLDDRSAPLLFWNLSNPPGEGREVHFTKTVATSTSALAMRFSFRGPEGPRAVDHYAIHVFKFDDPIVDVLHPEFEIYQGGFQNRTFYSLESQAVTFDSAGAPIALPGFLVMHWPFIFPPAVRETSEGISVDFSTPTTLYRNNYNPVLSKTPYPSDVLLDGGPDTVVLPHDAAEYLGARWEKDGSVILAITDENAPDVQIEYLFRDDGTASARTVAAAADTELGVLTRRISPDETREAMLLSDPVTKFRQVYEGPVGATYANLVQRTYSAGAHTALNYSADGTQVYFFALDPLSGYEQLYRLEVTPAP